MIRPKFCSPFEQKSDFCEVSSSQPVGDFVPHQAITLKELVSRFERGQRLNVHSNFAPGSNFEQMTDEEAFERIRHENIDSDDFPPSGVYDVCDVESHYREHSAHKRDFAQRQRKKREEAQQAQPKQAPPASNTPPPPAE